MERSLRVLIIEDWEEDAELLVRELRRGGYQVEFERVETAEAMRAALNQKTWDLVLSDYTLPRFGVTQALEILKASSQDLPFILVSGTVGEETAIAALKAGAHDFILKGKLARLVPAIQRELRDARARQERRLALDALQKSEERFRLIVEYAPGAMVAVDTEGQIRMVNESAEILFGYTRNELIGRPLELLVPEKLRDGHRQLVRDYMTRPEALTFGERRRFRGVHSDGHEILLEIGLAPYESSEGMHVLALVNDITRRVQAETALQESEQQMRALVTSLDDIVFQFDEQGTYLNVWTADERLLVMPKSEILGKRLTDVFGKEQGDWFAKSVRRVITTGAAEEIEYSMEILGGQHWFVARISPVLEADGSHLTASMLIRDITNRKQVEAAYVLSQKRFQSLIEHAPDGIALLGLDGKLRQVTPSTEGILGYTLEESQGQDPALLTHPEDLPALLGLLNDLIQNPSTVVNTQYRFKHKDGSWRWLESTVSNLIHEPGVEAIVFNFRDITGRRQAEEALRNSEQRFRALIENGLDYISLLDAEGTLIWESPANQRMLDYEPNEFVGKNILELVHPDDLEGIRKQFAELAREPGDQRHAVFRLQHSRGIWRWVEAIGTNLLHIPTVAAIVLNYRDITERKQAEESLQEAQARNESILASIADTHILFDRKWRYLYVNDAAARAIGRPREQILGYSLWEVYPDILGTELEGQYRRAMDDHLPVAFEFHYPAQDTWWENRFYPVPEGLAVFATDITERKRYEEKLRSLNIELEQRVTRRTEELNQTNIELEQANRIKDEFLANMSHELRTPLNSILGLSELLLEQGRGPLNEYQQKSLEIIGSSGRHLLELINDVLDLSKIEAGHFDYYPEPVPVDEVCKSSLTFIRAQAAKKSITVTYTNQSAVAEIFADLRRLKQILVNLLTNAVKFTPEYGHVTLEVSTNLEEDLIRFSVIDTGIGIAPEDMERLFQPFVQVESSLNRQHEGTGLGLALVQKLTDLHGGSVHVESETGKGSRFTVNLACNLDELAKYQNPSRSLESQAGEQPKEPAGVLRSSEHGYTILLAEDNLSNVLTVGEYLESHGLEVTVAHDGLEALEKAEMIKPDIILMDIQMPAMDGLEATRRLRAIPHFAATPIIALTALAMPGDRERCLEAGADDYMSKPVSLKTLLKTIEGFLE